MKYKLITIEALHPERGEQELNSFLGSHKIISVEKKCCQTKQQLYWTFAICYEGAGYKGGEKKRGTIDYKEVLSEDDFTKYARLRELRNDLAKEYAKPPYAIFTNEQLARMVVDKVSSSSALAKIDGIGKARLEQYSEKFLPLLSKLHTPDTK